MDHQLQETVQEIPTLISSTSCGSKELKVSLQTPQVFTHFIDYSKIHLKLTLLDPTCAVTGFISLGQTVCLECNSGYVLVDKQCLTQCPSDHFLYSPTNSCQSKY